MIEQIQITSREQWLAARQQDITASAAGALLGLHPYQTAFGLWAEKTGLVSSDGATSPAMQRGLELEPIAIARLAKLHPTWSVERPNAYYRDPEARLGATPDCLVNDPERDGWGCVQIKSVEPSAFREHWCEDDEIRPPLWIACQVIVEAHLVGADWAAVAALVIGYGIDLHVIDVPIHAAIITRIKDETRKFWQMIEEGREPEPDYGRDAHLIEQLFARPEEIEVDLSADNELPEAVAEYQTLGKSIAEISELRKARRAEILHKMGNATKARIATGTITAKSIKRKGYVVEPSSYRAIKFRETPA
jgi:predicted phage-related endonuclease